MLLSLWLTSLGLQPRDTIAEGCCCLDFFVRHQKASIGHPDVRVEECGAGSYSLIVLGTIKFLNSYAFRAIGWLGRLSCK